jgi:hypothetical protein
MILRMRLVFVALLAVLAATNLVRAGDLPRVVHGSSDVYSASGIALAWGILRDADEAKTIVVVRIVTDPNGYPVASVTAIDPFTERKKTQLNATPVKSGLDVRLPRPSFGDLPRTEFRFFRSDDQAWADAPELVVYYSGVPDTAPEFADEAALDQYLARRIEDARGGKGAR